MNCVTNISWLIIIIRVFIFYMKPVMHTVTASYEQIIYHYSDKVRCSPPVNVWVMQEAILVLTAFRFLEILFIIIQIQNQNHISQSHEITRTYNLTNNTNKAHPTAERTITFLFVLSGKMVICIMQLWTFFLCNWITGWPFFLPFNNKKYYQDI